MRSFIETKIETEGRLIKDDDQVIQPKWPKRLKNGSCDNVYLKNFFLFFC